MILLMLLPAFLLLFLVFGLPIIRYAWISMHSYSVITSLVPINNYGANWIRLFNDQRFWQDAYQTIRFAAISVTLEVFIAIGIALLLNQKLRGRGIIRAASLLPWALPTTIMALGWRWIFNTTYGPIEQINSLYQQQMTA